MQSVIGAFAIRADSECNDSNKFSFAWNTAFSYPGVAGACACNARNEYLHGIPSGTCTGWLIDLPQWLSVTGGW